MYEISNPPQKNTRKLQTVLSFMHLCFADGWMDNKPMRLIKSNIKTKKKLKCTNIKLRCKNVNRLSLATNLHSSLLN